MDADTSRATPLIEKSRSHEITTFTQAICHSTHLTTLDIVDQFRDLDLHTPPDSTFIRSTWGRPPVPVA